MALSSGHERDTYHHHGASGRYAALIGADAADGSTRLVRGFGGYAATHVEGTAEVLRLAEVFVMLALTSFLWAAQHF